jgi:hypothetical protein
VNKNESEGLALALAAFQDILRNSDDHFQGVISRFRSEGAITYEFLLTPEEAIEFENCAGNREKYIDFASERFIKNKDFRDFIFDYMNTPKLDIFAAEKFETLEIIESAFIVCKDLPSVKKFLKFSGFIPKDMYHFGLMFFAVLQEELKKSPVLENNSAYVLFKNVLNKEYNIYYKKYTELEKSTSQSKQDYILLIKKIDNLTFHFNWLKKIDTRFFTYPTDSPGYCDVILRDLEIRKRNIENLLKKL